MALPEAPAPQEMVNVSLGDIHRLFYITQRFRDVLSSDLLVDLDLFPQNESESKCSVLYTSVFVESEARVMSPQGQNIDFKALVPVDVNQIETSTKKPIALPRQLDDEKLQIEIKNFIAGKSSDLAAANITHILSLQNEPTIVVVQNSPSETHRTLSMLRTKRVDDFIVGELNGGKHLGDNIIVESGSESDKTVRIQMSNKVWGSGRVVRHGDSQVFIDPVYSINLPLFRDGKCFIVQFGLDKPPLNTLSIEYITTLKNLQVFAQKELDLAWTEADNKMKNFPDLDAAKFRLDVHDLKNKIQTSQGFLQLLITVINNAGVDESLLRSTIKDYVQRAIDAIEGERIIAEQMLDTVEDTGKYNFTDKFTSALQSVNDWLLSAEGKEKTILQDKLLNLIVNNNVDDEQSMIICKSWMFSKLILGAIENGFKHIKNGEKLDVVITANKIDISDRKFIELTIANNDGGTTAERLEELRDPDTQRVQSDTNTSGIFLKFIATELRKLGRQHDYVLPIEFDNTDIAGSLGFTIKIRLPVQD